MLVNHITTAIRQAVRYKGYTAINMAGLIVGLVSSMLILLWVVDETTKDQFHNKSDRLYQVWRNIVQSNGDIQTTWGIPFPLEHVLRTEYPEVEHVTAYTWEMESLFRVGDASFFEKGRYAIGGFFDVFGYRLILGDPAKILLDAPTMVISDRMALKFFGKEWRKIALGQSIRVDNKTDYEVTGVFEWPGDKSSMQFDWLIAAQGFMEGRTWINSWYNGGFSMFFTLKPGTHADEVQKRLEGEVIRNTNRASNEPLYMQLVSENYLHGTFENGRPSGGRIQYVRIMSAIAASLLLLAAINFMNLATARSSLRAREIGVRKIMGAQRRTLSQQFIVEAMLYAVSATVVSAVIVYLVLPYFNTLTGKSINLDLSEPVVWLTLAGIVVLTGALSGAYPAFMISALPVTKSLKGRTKQASGKYLRQALVTFQFAISIFLISGTFIISKQLSYILNKDIGLQRENLMSVDLSGDLYDKQEVYLNSLRNIPGVVGATVSSSSPINLDMSTGGAQWPGKHPEMALEINVLSVSAHFVETMGMKVVRGDDFSDVFVRDSARFLINEALADIMGFDDPIGKELSLWGTTGVIAGVVANFHMASLYQPIGPLIIRYSPGDVGTAFIRLKGDTQEVLDATERVTTGLSPAFPFRYRFVDEDFARQYHGERSVSSLVNIFAGVSIFIACLGLLGLSSFSADQRAKEIGVRKVHGASTTSIMLLLSGQYARLMIIAFIVATPFSYLFMQRWLGDFAYRVDVDIVLFFLAGILTFVIGAFTVSFKSYSAAQANPANTLKEE